MISRSDFIVCTLSIGCLAFGLYRWHLETNPSPRSSEPEQRTSVPRNVATVRTATVMSASTVQPLPVAEDSNPEPIVASYNQPTAIQQVENEARQNDPQPSGSKTTVIVLSAHAGRKPVEPVEQTLDQTAQAPRQPVMGNLALEADNPGIQPAAIDSKAVVAGKIHRVSSGENLTLIARRLGTSVAELKRVNGLENDRILIGQELLY